MNRVYKVIYSKARQCAMVVSELAKSSHKNSRRGAGHTGTLALARIVAAALVAGTLTWGSVPEVSWAADNTTVKDSNGNVDKKIAVIFDDKGSLLSTDATIDHNHEDGFKITNVSKGIALGHNAYVFNQGGRKADAMLFGSPTYTSGIAIGENAYVLEDSIDLGNKIYKGAMGDVSDLSTYEAKTSSGTGRLLIGNNSYSSGTLSTLIGNHSIMTTNYSNDNPWNVMQNAGAVSIGALNSIESYSSDSLDSYMSGVANSIIGLANKTTNANGALILGAGNEIKNSITSISVSGSKETDVATASQAIRDSMANGYAGGATLVIGGGNKADYTQKTQIIGVNNKVTGTEGTTADFNLIDGYKNTATHVKHATVIGSGNTVSGEETDNVEGLILLGDNRNVWKQADHSVVIGSSDDTGHSYVTRPDTVVIGHNAYIEDHGGNTSGGGDIAIGHNSFVENYVNQSGSIAFGENTHVRNSVGSTENAFVLGQYETTQDPAGTTIPTDDGKEISKKLNNTLEIIGGANRENLTDGNIGVNSTDKGQLKVQLAKDLKGITSISNQKTEGDKTTGAKIDLGTDGSVDVNGGKITNVGSGADESGSYTTTTNAANIGDVQKIVKNAVDSASDTTNKALAGKANIDATNIGANLKGADGKAASAEDQKANAEKWGSAIGTGKIEKDNGQLVTGKTVYEYNKPIAEDGKSLHYVSEQYTTGQNLSALDAHVKDNADAITQINTSISTLDQNAVKYDDSTKSKITLAGGGTTITNVKDGKLSDDSTEAVNGRQLNAVQKQVTNNTTEITKIENGEGFTDAGETVIKNLSKDAVQVNAGTAITVAGNVDDKGNKTYTISANNNGTVANGDGNLISGDTLYKEVHVDKDGSYIKGSQSVGKNLSALDSGLKTTSDLIHTNDKGDIQIGGSSTATKIDVSGKDAKGNTTGRFITGVVTDAGDPTSAANVGYVNGVTAANTQQIYRDMNNAYGRLNNNINKAAAGSNALAALHPLDYDPDDKADFAVGYGHYRNANAAAVGAFYHPNENTMVNVGVSLGNGDPGFNAGVSFKIGSGSAGHQAMSKTEMAKVINSQSKEIDALKKDNADKDKRIDALEQKMAEILAKLDKNGK